MYRVRNVINRRESDVICHSVRRSWVPTSCDMLNILNVLVLVYSLGWCFIPTFLATTLTRLVRFEAITI